MLSTNSGAARALLGFTEEVIANWRGLRFALQRSFTASRACGADEMSAFGGKADRAIPLLAAFSRSVHNSPMAGVENRCLVAAAAILMSLTADALAQLTMPGMSLSADRPQLTKEEQEKRKAVDDAYKSTINKLPDKKKPADPWGDIRSPAANSARQR